jgi:hypothetical protein
VGVGVGVGVLVGVGVGVGVWCGAQLLSGTQVRGQALQSLLLTQA